MSDSDLEELSYIVETTDYVEVWKPVISDHDNHTNTYEISNVGKIRNKLKPEELRVDIEDNRWRVKLTKPSKWYFVGELVARSFLDDVPDSILNYKNNNTRDNFVDNLEWKTEDKEIWVPLPVEGYEHLYKISNKARVLNLRFNKIKVLRRWGRNDVLAMRIPSQKKSVQYYIHNLVAAAFVEDTTGDPANSVVVHIDGDDFNNNSSNLKYIIDPNAIIGEIWKPVHIEEFKKLYEVSDHGRVRNSKDLNMLNHELRHDKYWVKLFLTNTYTLTILQAKLVATAFLENPNEHKIVLHKDGNAANTNVANLEWSDNSLPDEKWLPFASDGFRDLYEISNMGRVRNKETQCIIKQFDRSGYCRVTVSDTQDKTFSIHRIVALAFIGNPPSEECNLVNHKDGDKANNHMDNLEWVTRSDNTKHSYEVLGQKRATKSVICTNVETNEEITYTSIKEAATVHNFGRNVIAESINQNVIINGNKWRYADQNIPVRLDISKLRKIVGYDDYYFTEDMKIYSYVKNKYLTPNLCNDYPIISLQKDKSNRSEKIHILVARTFIPNDDPSKTQVNHIDHNKQNYQPDNLEWVTPSENVLKSYKHRAMIKNQPVLFPREDNIE